MSWVLGLDTSCYTTSAAAVGTGGNLIAAERRLLTVPQGSRGLRQSEMVFQHTAALPALIESVIGTAGREKIVAVCAATRPRAVEGSYMPAFTVGENVARIIAAALGVPRYATSHQQGHIEAARMESGLRDGAYLALHLSGGTTEVLACTGDPPEALLLGATHDIALGQLVDRVGVRLGLPFPAGPHLESLAREGQPQDLLPLSVDGCDMNASGAEAAVMRWIDAEAYDSARIAAEVFSYLARTVARLLHNAARQTGIAQALLAGGIASSGLFRTLLEAELARSADAPALHWARPELAGDNAVGVAAIGAALYRVSR